MTSDKATHNYRVEAVRSGNWWSITVPELSGVFSQAQASGSGRDVGSGGDCHDAGHRRSGGRLA